MKAKKRASKPKKLTPSVPKAIPHTDIQQVLGAHDETPSVFWDTVEDTWDWVELRKGGKLSERVQQLDRHFVTRGKTHKVCPIVLLLNCGEKE